MFNKLCEISSTPEDTRTFNPDPDLPIQCQKIGIEIEMEGVTKDTLRAIAAKGYWEIHQENSLRGHSGELASIPVFGLDIQVALDHLKEGFRRVKKPVFNARTSLHIHMDVMDLNKEELIRFIMLYAAFERLLFGLCDSTRQNNPYCLPLWRSEGTKAETARIIEAIENGEGRTVKHLIAHWAKYNAMNLNNIVGIGTIEFRHLHGTIDQKEIRDWIKVLMCIKKYAKEKMESYNDFPEIVSGFIPQDYLVEVFGPELAKKFSGMSIADDLLRGVRCAQDILMYRRLQRSTSMIYAKQTGKETSSFSRLTGYKQDKEEEYFDPYLANSKAKKKVPKLTSTVVGNWHPAAITAAVPPELFIDEDDD